MRVGIGFDVHRLVPETALVIGGVTIPYQYGLEGFSDADVLLHAICDALLGALRLGDLGTHFPSDDERFRDIESSRLVEQVMRMVREERYRVGGVDAIVIADAPRLEAHKKAMEGNIAALLGCSPSEVNVKATTTNGVGWLSGEGIAAQAIVTLNEEKSDG